MWMYCMKLPAIQSNQQDSSYSQAVPKKLYSIKSVNLNYLCKYANGIVCVETATNKKSERPHFKLVKNIIPSIVSGER